MLTKDLNVVETFDIGNAIDRTILWNKLLRNN
jgi:hypothetical protein